MHELGRARKPRTGDRKLEKGHRGRREEERGKGSIYGRRESSETSVQRTFLTNYKLGYSNFKRPLINIDIKATNYADVSKPSGRFLCEWVFGPVRFMS